MKRGLKYIILTFCFCVNLGQVFGQIIQLGTGMEITGEFDVSPINTLYTDLHYQVVYTAVELQAAGATSGDISKLGFFIETVSSSSLPNFTIKLKHVNESDAATTVYTSTLYTPTTSGFDMLDLTSTFFWNGVDDILVEICFDGISDFTSGGTVRYYSEVNTVQYYGDYFNPNVCSVPPSNFSSKKPQIQLEFTPLSSYDIKPSFLANFTICGGTNDVYVKVNNRGDNELTSAILSWEINGIVQPPVTPSFNPAIPTGGQSIPILLGSFDFVDGQTYTIKVWSSNPNGNTDENISNDTISAILSTHSNNL